MSPALRGEENVLYPRDSSPGQYETINPYGTLTFDIPGVLGRPADHPPPLTRV